MIRLVAPEWLILLPLLTVVAFVWRRPGLTRPLRAFALLLLVLILAHPALRRLSNGLDLFVLVDRSASAADAMTRQLPEWEILLDRSKGPNDRLRFIDFAELPVERAPGTASAIGRLESSNLALAIQTALARQSPDRAARLLALTDGFSTEPLDTIGETLAAQQVALDYRWPTPPDATDYGVTKFQTPTRVQPGEPFLVELTVTGRPDAAIPFTLLRDDTPIQSATVTLSGGTGTVRFTDRLTAPGAHRYSVRLTAPGDTISGNNVASSWTEITGGNRILLVTAYPDDPIATVLRAQGFPVDIVTDPTTLDPGRLTGTRAVLLHNVPAPAFPENFLPALDFYVRSQGGGLLMIGGPASFGSGGYFRSPIDELLPVSMELRTEHRKLAVAMAIVMDSSGSMGATVPGGMTKMDLANEGAARAIALLGPSDAVSVLAVDSEPHVVVSLTALTAGRDELVATVRRIQSGGGGIFVYNGLQAGWTELQKSPAGQRHLILFADAADSEQPDDYINLIAEMTTDAATISVIGLGTPTDPDANFLKDIAARAGGRIFFTTDAATLPALFEQETVAVARSAFLNEPVGVEPSAGWLEIAARPLAWPDALDGYNLSYLRPDATAAAFTRDEYRAPLTAFWQRGAGRTAAVTFPLAGPDTPRARDWPAAADFLQTLTRWLTGTDLPPGLGLHLDVNGSQLELDLRFDDDWQDRFAANPPEILTATESATTPATWERQSPGHYRARLPLPPGETLRGAIRAGEFTIPFGPVTAGLNPEWHFDPARRAELTAAANLSGGRERVDLSKIWEAPRREAFTDLRPWLLALFLVIFLLEALLTRLGIPVKFPFPRRATEPQRN